MHSVSRFISRFRRLFAVSLGRAPGSGCSFPVSAPRGPLGGNDVGAGAMMRQARPWGGTAGHGGAAAGGLNDQWFAKLIAPWRIMTPILSNEVMGFLLHSPASSYEGHVGGGGLRTARPTSAGYASARREVGRLVLLAPPSGSTLPFRTSVSQNAGAFADRGTHRWHGTRRTACHTLTLHWPPRVLLKAALRTLTNMYRRLPPPR